MFRLVPGIEYFVWPSWANLAFTWEMAADSLSKPYSRLHAKELNDAAKKHVEPVQPARMELNDGSYGNGIIVVHERTTWDSWIGLSVLWQYADTRCPQLLDWMDDFKPKVLYLEPHSSFYHRLVQKPSKVYPPGVTVEHADSAREEDAFWTLSWTGTKEPKAIAEFPDRAAKMGVTLNRLPAIPEHIKDEAGPWFIEEGKSFIWYSTNVTRDLGKCIALMTYLDAGVKEASKGRARCLHLVAQIEGKPNIQYRFAHAPKPAREP